jgi:hypothetical protein
MPTDLERRFAEFNEQATREGKAAEERALEARFRAVQADQAQGGSIRQGHPAVNFPVGATVGGMVGAGAGLAVTRGNPVGALVGGAVGTGVGELAQQGYELLKDPGAAPKTLAESAARVGEQEVYQAIGEGVGRLAGGLIAGRRIAPGIPASISPQEHQAMTFLTQRGYSQGYMPSEVTETRGLDILHNIAEFSLFGGGAIKKFRQKREREVFADLANQMVADLGPKLAPDDVGRAVVYAVNHNLELEKIPIKMEYNTIEALAAPGYTHVPTRMKVVRSTGSDAIPHGDTPVKERDAFGESLVEFLRKRGGVQDQGGEVGRFEIKGKPGQKALVKSDGMGLDTAAEVAHQAGYLESRDVNGLLKAIESESRGKPVFSPQQANSGREQDLLGQQFDREAERLNVKTGYQSIQVGEQLQRLKVMTATQELQISGARIDLSPLKEELSGALRTAKEAGGLENKAMGTTMLQFLDEKPDIVSYPVAKQIRTELRTMRDGLAANPETKNAPAIALAEKAYASMTKRIVAGLNDFDPTLGARFEDVSFREAGRQGQFNNDIVRALVKDADTSGSGKPEAIVDQVFQHNNVTTINNLKNAVDAPTWDKMLSWHWRDVYAKSDGNGAAMREAFFGAKSGLGEKEMVQAYGPERVGLYKQVINAMEVGQKQTADKTGTIFIQLKQPGAVMQLSGAALAGIGLIQDEVDISTTALGAAIVLAPPVLARLMTNPTSIKWILQGMKIPAGTREATALATRLLPIAFPRLATQAVTEPPPPSKTGLPPLTSRPLGDQP